MREASDGGRSAAMAQPPRSFIERLTEAQHERPGIFIAVASLLAAASLALILGVPGVTDGLSLNSDFTATLPETARSVQDMEEIRERFGGQQAMVLTVESEDTEALHRFVRVLAPRIGEMEELQVVDVDWNLSDFRTFVEEHRHLYAELEDLQAIRDALQARLDDERARANPFFIDLEEDDERDAPDPEALMERLQREAEEKREEMDARFPEGFLQHPEHSIVLVVVHTRIRGGAIEDTAALQAAIAAAVEDLGPDDYASDLEVRYGGTIMEVREETLSLVAAVRNATVLTIALVMLGIYAFFLRARSIPLLAFGLLPPVLVTFGIAELTVDYLNASSAFLSAIVVGNGINPNVIWLSRYFELRRAGSSVRESLTKAQSETWRATLTASLAAGVAYGSLMSTDYRGFRDFGIVGGTGMILCWAAAHLLLPALTALSERWRPMKIDGEKVRKGIYGVLFARVALGWPRAVVATSVLLTIASGGLVAYAIVHDPLEYDFRNLRSERDPDSDIAHVSETARGVVDDTRGGHGLAVLASNRDEARQFTAWLEEHRDEFPNAYGQVESVELLLPSDQEEKLPLVRELRELMLQVRPRVDAEMQATIDEQLPPEDVRELVPSDLPRSVARPFTERDGTRGRLLVVEHHPDENNWDGLYTERWAQAARALRMENGEPPPVAGTAVVMSDVMRKIWDDGPRAIGIAFVATVLLVLFAFRRHRDRWATIGALLVGILWMAGTMAAFGMHLNFLNFVAFPITFGNGADYGVNVMRRVSQETDGGADLLTAVRRAVEGTGGAVVLCSLTTVIGYISIYTSSNQALNSFGAAMAISEVTCLAAAVLALPAALCLFARRRAG